MAAYVCHVSRRVDRICAHVVRGGFRMVVEGSHGQRLLRHGQRPLAWSKTSRMVKDLSHGQHTSRMMSSRTKNSFRSSFYILRGRLRSIRLFAFQQYSASEFGSQHFKSFPDPADGPDRPQSLFHGVCHTATIMGGQDTRTSLRAVPPRGERWIRTRAESRLGRVADDICQDSWCRHICQIFTKISC